MQAGMWPCGGRRITCHAALGDQQYALLGVGLDAGELSLNIATGSQVARRSRNGTAGECQLRPYFDAEFIRTVTHIPAGRTLNLLVRLLTELSPAGDSCSAAETWCRLAECVGRTPETDLDVNLSFFPSVSGDRGWVRNLHEGNCTVGHLFRAAFRHMAANYREQSRRLGDAEGVERLVLSGGLVRNMPPLQQCIMDEFGLPVRVACCAEDTLAGLLVLARVLAGSGCSLLAESAENARCIRVEDGEGNPAPGFT